MAEQDDPSGSGPDPAAFDPEEADLEPRLALRSSFAETLSQHGFADTLVLSRERAAVVFHERRLAVLDYLSSNDPPSVRALAEELGYDKGLLSRDLQELAAIDVVEYERNGRAKAPRLKHAHVVVEPVV